MFLEGPLLLIRRDKLANEPLYMGLGLKPDGRREVLGPVFLAEEESSQNGEEGLQEFQRRGMKGARIFGTDDLPGPEKASRKLARGAMP